MELLAMYGTPLQKEKWLKPLLNGDIRSCFGMTEPDVASSDALNLKTRIDKNGDQYIVNGRKWWISGAMDPRCEVMLLIGKGPQPLGKGCNTDSSEQHRQHSIVLVPLKNEGVHVGQYLTIFGYDDAPHGHAEISLSNVKLNASEALLFREGGGFEAAQSRLGGGRLHHCMRLVGIAERAQSLLIARANSRKTFGKQLLENDSVVQIIGQTRCDIETMRAVVRSAAIAVDKGDVTAIQRHIGVAKVVVPRLACKVVDRAIQVHGGAGVSQNTVLGILYALARSLRIADGPDEVHLRNIAKGEIKGINRAKL